jgi:hypothetical protein
MMRNAVTEEQKKPVRYNQFLQIPAAGCDERTLWTSLTDALMTVAHAQRRIGVERMSLFER